MYPTFEKIRNSSRRLQKNSNLQRVIRRQLHTSRDDADSAKRQVITAICWKAPAKRSVGQISFLGYDPSMEITCTDGILRIRKPVRRKFLAEAAMLQKAVQKAVQKRFDRLPIQAMPSGKSSVSTKVRLWTICPPPAVW